MVQKEYQDLREQIIKDQHNDIKKRQVDPIEYSKRVKLQKKVINVAPL